MKPNPTIDFLLWALTHVRPDSIPEGAALAAPHERCGIDPWEYLFGTSGQVCTQKILDERFSSAYSEFGWGSISFEAITNDWAEQGVSVCDGPGLLNAYRKQICGIQSAMTEHGIFSRICCDKAAIGETYRAFEPGEAVFISNRYGLMKRVGWVCGFDAQDEPLVIEARGLCYGVCIAPFRGRGWTHRARMNLMLDKEDADAD